MISRPKPDWGRKGTQPTGELGPKPEPNGRIVATQPMGAGWEPSGRVVGYVSVPPMTYVSPPLDVLPPRFLMRAPVIKRWVRHRPLAVIEAEIRRATVPGLRPEDV